MLWNLTVAKATDYQRQGVPPGEALRLAVESDRDFMLSMFRIAARK